MKRYSYKVFSTILIVLTTLAFASQALLYYYTPQGFVEADVIRVVDNSIIIGSNCTAIIAETSPERAHSIELGLERRIEGRPNTHDTLTSILKSFNISLESAQISRYDNDYYYSYLILRNGDKVSKIDVMPSDAIALALRMNSTIYINRTLLSELGRDICSIQ